VDPLVRRLQKILRGWLVSIGVGTAAGVVIAAMFNPQNFLGTLLGVSVIALFLLGLLAVGIMLASVAWLRYVRPAHTTAAEEVLGSIAMSKDEYCLILRPFGHDGATIMPRWRMAYLSPMLALEQVVALEIRRSFGMKTYAMVDQDQKLAPPGPVYLRAAHADWQKAVRVLLARVHTVFLLLPPSEDPMIRDSFAWELKQITYLEFQSRAIAVLPPWNRPGYKSARHQACAILATLEGFAGEIDEAEQRKINHYERTLPETTVLAKLSETDISFHSRLKHLMFWSIAGGRKNCGYKTYARALVEAVRTNGKSDPPR